MKLSNSFTIDHPVQEVYDAFLDIERIATCMPGSTLTGQSGQDTYDGEVKVKVGPLGVAYAGQFTMLDSDTDQHRLTMRARGREKRGAGNADAHIVATLAPQDGSTVVTIDTDLDIRGKVAQFGRGVIGEVTDGIMQVFAGNVQQMLSGGPSAAPAPTSAPRAPASVPVATPAAAAQPAPVAAAPTAAPQASTDLDAWTLLVRPMLQRHAASAITIGMSALAAYVGARLGSRHGN